MPGLADAMAALMQQFGGGGSTVAGSMPSAYQTTQAAASVPSWSSGGATGGAPMASPLQSVPGMTSSPGPIMGALQNPQSYGGGGQGGSLARQGTDMVLSAAMTAALTPILGPAAPIAGPMLAHAGTSLIPHKGGGGTAAPVPQLQRQAPGGSQIPGLGGYYSQDIGGTGPGMGNDQYAMLLQLLQNGGMRM